MVSSKFLKSLLERKFVRDTLILLGCAPVLGLLADRLNQRSRDLRVAWLSRTSRAALDALAARRAHVAGVHFVDEKSAELPEEERRSIAAVVGVGSVQYADLCQNRSSDYVFSWDKMISLEGNTAAYLLYAVGMIVLLAFVGRT